MARSSEMDLLDWLQQWYLAQCDGDWEHRHGVHINTLDNPGWIFSVDLKGTNAEGATMPAYERDHGDDDWIVCQVVDGEVRCNGDPTKLIEMMERFRQLVTLL